MELVEVIKLVDVDDLIPYINNPKEHPTEQINKIASSIKNYGFTVPLVIDNQNEIIAGHGRYEAAKKLGLAEVPCIVRDDLNTAQIKALRIADNKVAESEWDYEMLGIELEDLSLQGFELTLTGFDDDEIEAILQTGEEEELRDDDFDVDAALDEDYLTEKDDMWLLGRHRVLCGDSTDSSDIGHLMDGKIADMVFTDPPYNVNYESKSGLSIENDDMENDEFYNFLYDFYDAALEHTKEGGAIYVCHADSEGVNFRKALTDSGWLLKQAIVWVKNQLVLGRQDYQWKHEPILYGWKPGAAHCWNGDRKQTTVIQDSPQVKVKEKGDLFEIHFDTGIHTVVMRVPSYDILSSGDDTDKTIWYFDKPVKSAEHPTMKPVGIPGRAIKNSTKKDEIVLDPFGGSGSTLIAAEQTGRISYLNELDPKYVDVIVKRYIEFKNNNSDVFLIRAGEKISYKDLI